MNKLSDYYLINYCTEELVTGVVDLKGADMIQNLQISNFKSIHSINLECARVNVLIGEPNVGKSNILEALALYSLQEGYQLGDFVRLNTIVDLFYDQDTTNTIEVQADDDILSLVYTQEHLLVNLESMPKKTPKGRTLRSKQGYGSFSYTAQEQIATCFKGLPVRIYHFRQKNEFPNKSLGYLLPPFGDNLMALVHVNKKIHKWFNEILSDFDLELAPRPEESKLVLIKRGKGTSVLLPYTALAETLQRLLFYYIAMETNQQSTILLEEPEAHLFPHYAKFIGERIGAYNENQFFISTHNALFLNAIVEKTPVADLQVFAVEFKKGQTRVVPFRQNQLSMILDMDTDIFFNLEKVLTK